MLSITSNRCRLRHVNGKLPALLVGRLRIRWLNPKMNLELRMKVWNFVSPIVRLDLYSALVLVGARELFRRLKECKSRSCLVARTRSPAHKLGLVTSKLLIFISSLYSWHRGQTQALTGQNGRHCLLGITMKEYKTNICPLAQSDGRLFAIVNTTYLTSPGE